MAKLQWGRDLKSKCGRFRIEKWSRKRYDVYDLRFTEPGDVGIHRGGDDLLCLAKLKAEEYIEETANQYGTTSVCIDWLHVGKWDAWAQFSKHCPFCQAPTDVKEEVGKATRLLDCLRFSYECGGAYIRYGPRPSAYVQGVSYYDWSGSCPRLERAAAVGLPAWFPIHVIRDREEELDITKYL